MMITMPCISNIIATKKVYHIDYFSRYNLEKRERIFVAKIELMLLRRFLLYFVVFVVFVVVVVLFCY
jgi:hypothetical protein